MAKVLRAVFPNQGLMRQYKNTLACLIDEMHSSCIYWLAARYKRHPPIMALDASPATQLKLAISKLSRRWRKRFNQAAPRLAAYFATKMKNRSDKVLKQILKDSGITVKFRMTQAMKDVFQATVQANVSLIKSIPSQYFGHVEGLVMRSVQSGRDLAELSRQLQKTYKLTRQRAGLIARDQNNKATASLQRARQVELGIAQAIWMHSGGGKHPRPSHVKAGKDKVKYDIATGWYDPHEKQHILPGELINCRCVSRPVIPGL
jgi:uncharacterized protein with gpF-like domain